MICKLCKAPAPEGGFGTRAWNGKRVPLLRCSDCRSYFTERRKVSPKAKASEAKHEAKESRKQKKRQTTRVWCVANKERITEYVNKPVVKQKTLERQRKWASTTVKGKEKVKKSNRRRYSRMKASPGLWLKECIRLKLGSVMRKHKYKDFGFSSTIQAMTEFKSEDDVLKHFSDQYEKGMTDANHGKGAGKWNIGHALPQAYFNPNNEADLKRCWMKANLFPQWENENLEQSSHLPSNAVLQKLLAAGCYADVIGPRIPSDSERLELESKARSGRLFV